MRLRRALLLVCRVAPSAALNALRKKSTAKAKIRFRPLVCSRFPLHLLIFIFRWLLPFDVRRLHGGGPQKKKKVKIVVLYGLCAKTPALLDEVVKMFLEAQIEHPGPGDCAKGAALLLADSRGLLTALPVRFCQAL